MNSPKHIVQVFPIENGTPNFTIVRNTHKFLFEIGARKWADAMNSTESSDNDPEYYAMYVGTEDAP